MEDLDALAATIRDGLNAVQKAQTEYDEAMWDIADPDFANLRHIHLHLAITVGKFAKLLEPRDHDSFHGRTIPPFDPAETGAIVADLLMHAAQVCNILEQDLGEAFLMRYRQNADRFAPASRLRRIGS